MTDKVQKIREEVERLKGWNNNVRNSTRHMTLQEEDFNRGKHSSYLEILNFIDSLQEEPVSEDFKKELRKYAKIYYNDNDISKFALHFAKWKEEQMMAKAVDVTVTGIREYKEENEVDFTLMLEKGTIPYELEEEIKVIVLKED